MNAENIITVLVAIIGSGALSTGITLVVARFRHDRQVDQLQSWTKELELLDALDQRAGLAAIGQSEASRNLATAVAARTHLNATIARRIVPTATWEGYFTVVVGVIAGFLGLMWGTYGLSGGGDVFGSVGNVILGSIVLIVGGLLVYVGVNTDGYRTKMGAVIEQSLEGHAGSQRLGAFEKKHQWRPGKEPSFPWPYQIVVPPQVRQSFKTYLMNLPSEADVSAEAEGLGQYDAGVDPEPSASDGAHQV